MGWRESLDLLDHCLSGVDLNKEKERKVTNLNAKQITYLINYFKESCQLCSMPG